MKLLNGYDRKRAPEEYRPMTIEEAKALRYGDHVSCIANDGTARRLKVNGAPRTWKRDPLRVEIPFKYGMYEYGTLRSMPDDGIMERLIVKL